jgi:hypothetical protein
MASDVLISYLPNEVLEYILESDIISAADVCNFGSTCTKFRNVVSSSNKLWKTKFLQRYVSAIILLEKLQAYYFLIS